MGKISNAKKCIDDINIKSALKNDLKSVIDYYQFEIGFYSFMLSTNKDKSAISFIFNSDDNYLEISFSDQETITYYNQDKSKCDLKEENIEFNNLFKYINHFILCCNIFKTEADFKYYSAILKGNDILPRLKHWVSPIAFGNRSLK